MEKIFGVNHIPMARTTQSAPGAKPSAKGSPEQPKPAPDTPATTPSLTGSKPEALEQLRKECLQCTRCELAQQRTNVVFGSGNPDADLMFVGEAPGEEEDKQGEPFVGKAGQLLTKMIEAIDMKRSEVYIGNVLKCRPPNNRTPLPHEMVACLPFLKQQIRIIKPKLICALGATATRALLGSNQPMAQVRGRFFEYEGIKLLPTFHPSYLLRFPEEKRKAWEDLKKVRDTLRAMKSGT